MKYNGPFSTRSDLRRPADSGTRAAEDGRDKIEPPTCIICDARIINHVAIRIRHGGIYRYGADLQKVRFVPVPFMDDTPTKWMCVLDPDDEEYLSCAQEHELVTEDDNPQFASPLNGLCEGWCCVCRKDIEPMVSVPPQDQDQWSSTLLLELGEFSIGRANIPIFRPWYGGHIHYHCLDDFNVSLDRLIVTSDSPEWFNEDW